MTYRDQILKCKSADDIHNLLQLLFSGESQTAKHADIANQFSADVRILIDEERIVILSGQVDYLRHSGAETPFFMGGTIISIK